MMSKGSHVNRDTIITKKCVATYTNHSLNFNMVCRCSQHAVLKTMPIHFSNGKCHIKQLKSGKAVELV